MSKYKFGFWKMSEKRELICGKCNTKQNMIKRIIGKEFCWWCPNCKDQISNSAVKDVIKQSRGLEDE